MELDEFRKLLLDMGRSLNTDLRTIMEPVARKSGLTMTQLRFLLEIQAEEPVNVGSLCHIVGENSGNCSSMCKKLENTGLVRRSRCPDDERCVQLTLTDKGRAILKDLSQDTDHRFATLREELSQEELSGMLNAMQHLTLTIHRLAQTPKEENNL